MMAAHPMMAGATLSIHGNRPMMASATLSIDGRAAEREMRSKIYVLEDAVARKAAESDSLDSENYQVNRLLEEAVKRNAELIDNVSVLQVWIGGCFPYTGTSTSIGALAIAAI